MSRHINITQLSIKDLLKSGTPGAARYLIPMYQRNYAWGAAEIEQLIRDTLDSAATPHQPYYIGTLVVFPKALKWGQTPFSGSEHSPLYEVIDGQQRLTTLFLLAACLKHIKKPDHGYDMSWFGQGADQPGLLFESRPGSEHTLTQLLQYGEVTTENGDTLDIQNSSSIQAAYQVIKNRLPKLLNEDSAGRASRISMHDFARYLFEHVQIMRVPVPDDTDLNHYFEAMNNRGEQLEKHEVLKARLMSALHASGDPQAPQWADTLHQVWEACANMERYVQMCFDVEARHRLFGRQDWSQFEPGDFEELNALLQAGHPASTAASQETDVSLSDIINGSVAALAVSGQPTPDQEDTPDRFSSVVNFPNFLLQVLRATTGNEAARLDDKALIPAFDTVLLKQPDAPRRIKQFIYDLLKCKWLYDHYIIKRETLDAIAGWSLKRLICRENRPDYVNTFGADEDSPHTTNRRLLMLQAALHVSAPAPIYKYWLNAALHYLYTAGPPTAPAYLRHLEAIARCFVYDRYLAHGDALDYDDIIYQRKAALRARGWADIKQDQFHYDNIKNNLVFNYLDYLLWVDLGPEARNHPFEFGFRSSVEHYYPQNPLFGQAEVSEEYLHCFGNLCLVDPGQNSRLGNRLPEEKRTAYQRGQEDSLKQGLMMAAEHWRENEIRKHNQDMLNRYQADLAAALQQPYSMDT